MCFHITKYTYPIRQIPAFISSNTYLTIIKHVHSFHRIRIFTSPHTHFPLHFVCVYVYASTINRTPTAANGLPITWRTLRKHSTSTHEMPNEHSARRRGRFIAPVSLHKQIHISALPNICIHIITHTYPHHQTRAFISSNTYIHITAHAFPPPFRVCLRICEHDKSDPYSCERPANYVANTPQTLNVHPRNA